MVYKLASVGWPAWRREKIRIHYLHFNCVVFLDRTTRPIWSHWKLHGPLNDLLYRQTVDTRHDVLVALTWYFEFFLNCLVRAITTLALWTSVRNWRCTLHIQLVLYGGRSMTDARQCVCVHARAFSIRPSRRQTLTNVYQKIATINWEKEAAAAAAVAATS